MFLLCLFVLQLGAATAPGDDSPDKGQVMIAGRKSHGPELLEPRAAADTSEHRKSVLQKRRGQIRSCTDADLVRKIVKTSAGPVSVLDNEKDIAAVEDLYKRFAYVDDDHPCSDLATYKRYDERRNEILRKMEDFKTTYLSEEAAGMTGKRRNELDTRVKSLQGSLNMCLGNCNDLEEEILSEVLSKDTDYCPDEARITAYDFMRLWKKPDFNLCSTENFGPFLQGLWSELDAADRQSACRLGARCAQGHLEKHLLDMKYNIPVVAVAIAQAVFAKESYGKKDVLSNEELAEVYAYLKHGGTFDDAAQKTSLDLGRGYAKHLKAILDLGRGYVKNLEAFFC